MQDYYRAPPQTAQKDRSKSRYLQRTPSKKSVSRTDYKYMGFTDYKKTPTLVQPVKMMHSPSWMSHKVLDATECPFTL